eukprot:scaffold89787_cov18-Tisochrysis_lutea.AAC.2
MASLSKVDGKGVARSPSGPLNETACGVCLRVLGFLCRPVCARIRLSEQEDDSTVLCTDIKSVHLPRCFQ